MSGGSDEHDDGDAGDEGAARGGEATSDASAGSVTEREGGADADAVDEVSDAADHEAPESTDVEALRQEVEEKYDFENFGPADMAEMTAEEWDAAFDPETWITGADLLDRVERDLKQRVADRDVFARVERRDDRLVAYSDTGYATVYGDGSVEGRGTVLRDVKPTVALCSMESYDVPDDPPDDVLPEPREVPEGTGDLGNKMLQVVAGAQVLAGVALFAAWLLISLQVVAPPGGGTVRSLNVVAMLVAGVAFVVVGVLLFALVANARLSDRFRAEEYRNRLRAVDLEPGERPDFLPDDESGGDGRGTRLPDGEDGASDGAGDGGQDGDHGTPNGDHGTPNGDHGAPNGDRRDTAGSPAPADNGEAVERESSEADAEAETADR